MHRLPRRKKHWYVVGLLAAVVVLVLALQPGLVPGWFGDDDAANAGRATLDEPFRGSPAASWENGASGIDIPPAAASGWMTKAQVALALEKTRDFLVSSNLDPGVLRGQRPDDAIAYLDPDQDDMQTFVKKAFTEPGKRYDATLLFSRFDPARTRLVGDVVKTRCTMTYKEGERRAVDVSIDVTFVYPVASAEEGSDEVTRTIVRRELDISWDDAAWVGRDPTTFSVRKYYVDSTNAGCDVHNGYLTPDFENTEDPDGPAVDPYDRDEPISGAGNGKCGTAVRS
ncbi:hypothetical protein [Streptomyces sp. VRA16 Mangrove soil]|uniref:hypothetical protein n=1 Tax=Streptomyces sp. VRA16 Mangrove soil TaxID=2817434 RepID=UPI0027DB0380|nr:hypothetical protein [Streptomyces sp. VRA16 Mangrove soil]